MPLHDHFHPPLSDTHAWESLHSDWASMIVHRLNEAYLPERYAAAQRVRLGAEVEVDIGTLESAGAYPHEDERELNGGGIATLTEVCRYFRSGLLQISPFN